MSNQNTINTVPVVTNLFRAPKLRALVRGLFLSLGMAVMFSSALAHGQASDTPQSAPSVVQANVKLVIGGQTIKKNSRVTLSVVGSSLHIASAKETMQVDASAIRDISTNEDSRQDINGAAKLATMAIPYGGGRALSLFPTTLMSSRWNLRMPTAVIVA